MTAVWLTVKFMIYLRTKRFLFVLNNRFLGDGFLNDDQNFSKFKLSVLVSKNLLKAATELHKFLRGDLKKRDTVKRDRVTSHSHAIT